MSRIMKCFAWLSILIVATAMATADTPVRIATYNMQYLNSDVGNTNKYGDRLQKLKEVVDLLEADIIALQEIDDRASLELVFKPAQWHLIIDDDSGDKQDVALAVRTAWSVPDFSTSEHAEDKDFLFPSSADNTFFPNRRDVLVVKVQAPQDKAELQILVVHEKARSGGRETTEYKRVGAARKLVETIEARFAETPFVLLGDFNDNPDDTSLNILETGLPNAPGGPEEIDGPFLLNLTEPLCAQGHVSYGLKSNDIEGDRVITIDPASRDRNNATRGTDDDNAGAILFDQLLIPAWMRSMYVADSARVFDGPAAVRGNDQNRASDHVPVYADFVLVAPEDVTPAAPVGTLRISALMPNPDGADDGQEQVTLKNSSSQTIDLAGWAVKDKAGNTFNLAGVIQPGANMTIIMARPAFLNNTGDDVWLLDPSGNTVSPVRYTGVQVQSGAWIQFN